MIKLIKNIYNEFERMIVALVEFDYEEALKEQQKEDESNDLT
ncbi:hypothetical protein [Alkalibacillus silvisoli]|uniref:Uncharacterized protein n=1 Tax=Alkalibacillus silvisoli TaxID=392823 RepID=A0ABP3JNI8_9BACI